LFDAADFDQRGAPCFLFIHSVFIFSSVSIST
jgi:hypothetical protein